MKTNNSPLARLRYHVTGAIERGEAQAIKEIRSEEEYEEARREGLKHISIEDTEED